MLSDTQWGHILKRVSVKPRSGIIPIGTQRLAPHPAFQDAERVYLAQHLATAFSKARPDEWVVFYLSRQREPGLNEFTSGGMYAEGSRLHLVLANYRVAVSLNHIVQQVRQDPLRPSGDSYFDLIAGEAQEIRTYRSWHLAKPFFEHATELVVDYGQTLQQAHDMSLGPDHDRLRKQPRAQRETEIETRFRTLEKLHREGLISEEEYQTKRHQLLDDL